MQDPSIYVESPVAECFMTEMNGLYFSGDSEPVSVATNVNSTVSLDLRPITTLIAKTAQANAFNRPLKVLLDTGSQITTINRNRLPSGCNPKTSDSPLNVTGFGGQKKLNQTVTLRDLRLPEFSPTRRIDKAIRAYVSPETGPYDMIIGTDTLIPLGIDPLPSTQTISWQGIVLKNDKLGFPDV